MANIKISGLPPGTPPYDGGTLVPVDVPIGGGLYETEYALLSDLAVAGPIGATGPAGPAGSSVATILEQLILNWDSNTPVVAGTSVVLLAAQWATATISSVSYSCAGGTFTANLLLNGTPISGLPAMAVSSTPNTSTISGGASLPTGNSLTLILSSVTGTPTTAIIQVNMRVSTS